MKRMVQKLHSTRGESLVELLASALVGSLSVGAMVTMILTSVHINESARGSDAEFYAKLSAAESQSEAIKPENLQPAETGTGGTVSNEEKMKILIRTSGTMEEIKISVDYYGSEGILSYKKKTP